MKYWKHIEAGDFKTYTKKFLKYYLENSETCFEKPEHVRCVLLKQEKIDEVLTLIPEMKEGLAKFGEINEFILIVLFDFYRGMGPIHIDHTDGLNNGVQARINFPLLNCEGTKTSFFEFNERQFNSHTLTKGGAKKWPEWYGEKFKPCSEVELNQPTVIRTTAPHAIHSISNNFPRISLSISFKDDVIKYLEQDDEVLEKN
jgi:hypothetical protein